MNLEVLRKLRVLTCILTMDDDEWFKLLNGWSNYFHMNNIRPPHQVEAFDTIMKDRVKHGYISVIAPGADDIR